MEHVMFTTWVPDLRVPTAQLDLVVTGKVRIPLGHDIVALAPDLGSRDPNLHEMLTQQALATMVLRMARGRYVISGQRTADASMETSASLPTTLSDH